MLLYNKLIFGGELHNCWYCSKGEDHRGEGKKPYQMRDLHAFFNSETIAPENQNVVEHEQKKNQNSLAVLFQSCPSKDRNLYPDLLHS